MKEFGDKLEQINTVVLDMDGVLTDGSVLINESGDHLRIMNIKDGYALQHAVKSGLNIAIISGGSSEGARLRFEKLGITEVHLGVAHKEERLKEVVEKFGVTLENVLYMGDDIPDYKVMEMAGIGACPADAAHEIRHIADYISKKEGGRGCVREVLEMILRLKGQWMNEQAYSW
jgi:3-deoxy-D-manno-octulosonate 8-phosphate phosphatase (KDO 8-P phosphatase)